MIRRQYFREVVVFSLKCQPASTLKVILLPTRHCLGNIFKYLLYRNNFNLELHCMNIQTRYSNCNFPKYHQYHHIIDIINYEENIPYGQSSVKLPLITSSRHPKKFINNFDEGSNIVLRLFLAWCLLLAAGRLTL